MKYSRFISRTAHRDGKNYQFVYIINLAYGLIILLFWWCSLTKIACTESWNALQKGCENQLLFKICQIGNFTSLHSMYVSFSERDGIDVAAPAVTVLEQKIPSHKILLEKIYDANPILGDGYRQSENIIQFKTNSKTICKILSSWNLQWMVWCEYKCSGLFYNTAGTLFYNSFQRKLQIGVCYQKGNPDKSCNI